MISRKTYRLISSTYSRVVAEHIAQLARNEGLEKVRIKKVKGKRMWEIWAYI